MNQLFEENDTQENNYAEKFSQTCFILLCLPFLTFINFSLWNFESYLLFIETDTVFATNLFLFALMLLVFGALGMSMLTEPSMDKKEFKKRESWLLAVSCVTIIPSCILFMSPALLKVIFEFAVHTLAM